MRNKIKEQNAIIEDIEELETLIKNGVIKGYGERFGSSDNTKQLQLNRCFQSGCAVEGSVNQNMYKSFQLAKMVFESIIADAARCEIKRLEEILQKNQS